MLPSRSPILAEAINMNILTKNHADSPHPHPDSPHSPHSQYYHPYSPQSHLDSPRSHDSPHSVSRFPIPPFTDIPTRFLKELFHKQRQATIDKETSKCNPLRLNFYYLKIIHILHPKIVRHIIKKRKVISVSEFVILCD